MRKASGLWAASGAALVWILVAALTVVFSLLSMLSSIVLAPVDRHRRVAHAINTLWGRSIFVCVPVWRLRVGGRRHLPRSACILVSNHQSLMDILALFGIQYQFKWMAKASLFQIPFLGWAMAAAKYIKLYRGQHGSIRETYAQAKRYLREGMPVLIFPEGTRSATNALLPFKSGAFKLAIEMGVPIVPIAISGTRELLQRGSWLVRAKGRVRISILPPIDASRSSAADADQLRDKTRELIARTLQHARAASL